MTFVEVVTAMGLLAGVAAVVFGGINLFTGMELRQRYRAEAAEVAHRVILQYLDDFRWLTDGPKRIEMGSSFYHFEYAEYIILGEQSAAGSVGGSEDGARRRARAVRLEIGSNASTEQLIESSLKQLIVTVFREREDGSVDPEPLARISRIHNPITETRGNRGFEYLVWLLNQQGAEED